jgi:hypothetical protein
MQLFCCCGLLKIRPSQACVIGLRPTACGTAAFVYKISGQKKKFLCLFIQGVCMFLDVP